MNSQMELDLWKGDWGLVSVDLDCIRLAVRLLELLSRLTFTVYC